LLAQGLLSRGIGSLRYDKRGIAQSAPAAPREEQLRFETYVDDAIAWGRSLRNDPRFSSLTIVGHSEGALIGSVAARRLPADAFVSLEGSGRAAPVLIRDQLRPQLPPELMAQSERLVAELQAGRTSTAVPRGLEALFRPSVQPYLISWFRYDPAQEIAKLQMPVLIIHGSADAQVPLEDARVLHQANPSARMVIVPGMNHVLKAVAPSDQAKQVASLSDPTLPVVPQVLDELTTLIRSLSGPASRQ
jgi:pimeloyl-ACP methyl ester carboxylesterase